MWCSTKVVHPRSNRDLFRRVEALGAPASEYSFGEAPLAWRFPARNRAIAGPSNVVVVVEAPEKSGALTIASLITACHALIAGREVWGAPGPPGSPEGRGSNMLFADGAGVLWGTPEFLEAVMGLTKHEEGAVPPGLQPTQVALQEPETPEPPTGLPEDEAEVLRGVYCRSLGADVVVGRTGVEMRTVLSSIAVLDPNGYVARDAAGNDAAGNFAQRPVR